MSSVYSEPQQASDFPPRSRWSLRDDSSITDLHPFTRFNLQTSSRSGPGEARPSATTGRLSTPPAAPRLRPRDRFFWVWLSRIWDDRRSPPLIVKPETALRWHRGGFKLFCQRTLFENHPGGSPTGIARKRDSKIYLFVRRAAILSRLHDYCCDENWSLHSSKHNQKNNRDDEHFIAPSSLSHTGGRLCCTNSLRL